jgi:hypothetical protein
MKSIFKVLAVLITLTSCERGQVSEYRVSYEKSQTMTIEIDSCEYILYSTTRTSGGVCIIHKANCKNKFHNK